MHLLVWFPGGPKGRFMQYISMVKPPEGINAVTEPFLPAGGESPGGSRRQLEPWLQGHGRTRRHAHARTRGMHPARAGVRSPQLLPPGRSWDEGCGRRQEVRECARGPRVGGLHPPYEEHQAPSPAQRLLQRHELRTRLERSGCPQRAPSASHHPPRDGWQEAEGKELGDH